VDLHRQGLQGNALCRELYPDFDKLKPEKRDYLRRKTDSAIRRGSISMANKLPTPRTSDPPTAAPSTIRAGRFTIAGGH
jgi:hypothetical protein